MLCDWRDWIPNKEVKLAFADLLYDSTCIPYMCVCSLYNLLIFRVFCLLQVYDDGSDNPCACDGLA